MSNSPTPAAMPERRSDPVLDALKALLPDLEQSGVTELDVSVDGARLYLRRRQGVALPFAAGDQAQTPDGAALAPGEEGLIAIITPLSGMFYASPAPEEPDYIQEGDAVEADQLVGLVEAMKVFNEIHAEVPGTVVKVLAASGQLVQSGQTLIQIRPSAVPQAEGEAV